MNILHTVEFYHPSAGGAQEVIKRISEELVKRGHRVTVATSKVPGRTSTHINGVDIEEFDFYPAPPPHSQQNGIGNDVSSPAPPLHSVEKGVESEISSSAPLLHIVERGTGGEVTLQDEITRYRQFLLSNKFDVMMNYSIQVQTTDSIFPILGSIPYPKLLGPVGLFGLYQPENKVYFENLPGILRQYDHLILHSGVYRDAVYCRQHQLTHTTIIPNGASEEEFSQVDPTFRQRYHIRQNVPLLITISNHTGLKGHRLVIDAFHLARLHGKAMLLVVGRLTTDYGSTGCLEECRRLARWTRWLSFGRKQVTLISPDRPDVVAALHAADLFLFGSMVEAAPVVLFEAMASRTPFITVAAGNAAEVADWSGSGIVIPTRTTPEGYAIGEPEDMARAIENLLNHPDERQRLAENGIRTWKEHFTWEKIAAEYEQVYQSLIKV